MTVSKPGLQTVGKVGAGRRLPPPVNNPSPKDTNNAESTTIGEVANEPQQVSSSSLNNSGSGGGVNWTHIKESNDLDIQSSNASSSDLSESISASQPNSLPIQNQRTSTPPSVSSTITTEHRRHSEQYFKKEFPSLAGADQPPRISSICDELNRKRENSPKGETPNESITTIPALTNQQVPSALTNTFLLPDPPIPRYVSIFIYSILLAT